MDCALFAGVCDSLSGSSGCPSESSLNVCLLDGNFSFSNTMTGDLGHCFKESAFSFFLTGSPSFSSNSEDALGDAGISVSCILANDGFPVYSLMIQESCLWCQYLHCF